MRKLHELINMERSYKTELIQMKEKQEKIEIERAMDEQKREE